MAHIVLPIAKARLSLLAQCRFVVLLFSFLIER